MINEAQINIKGKQMTSQVLCFQRHSRQWDQNDFIKRSNVLNYHEHQSAQSHITRSEFQAYAD